MTLTQFEWMLVLAIGAILLGVVAFFLKRSQDDIMVNIEKLQKHDCDLAKIIESIVEKINTHEKWSMQEHTHLVSKEDYRDDLKNIEIKMDSFHKRMDGIRDMLSDIALNSVTREFCNERHQS